MVRGAGKRRGEAGVWEEFETFWRQMAKSILDMPIRAPTQGVFGELGWHHRTLLGASRVAGSKVLDASYRDAR